MSEPIHNRLTANRTQRVKNPIRGNDRFERTLVFLEAGEVRIQVKVEEARQPDKAKIGGRLFAADARPMRAFRGFQ